MKLSILFPGQGSQFPGMGREVFESFPEAKAVFEEVDDSLSRHLSRIIFEGTEEDLSLTVNTQPALLTVSMAVMRVLEKQGGKSPAELCNFMAGHSLGEYTALTASGALSLADSARLLQKRGEAMQNAVPKGTGAMAAILGLDFEGVQAIAFDASKETGEICAAANDNCPGQVVVSGHKGAVEAAIALAQDKGAKKAILLPVSVPSHCLLMVPALQIMEDALAAVEIKDPSVPVIANVTAQPVANTDEIPALLVKQLVDTVRWRESVLYLKEQGVTLAAELGAGKVLSGLVKRTDKEIESISVGTPEGVEALLKTL